MDEPERRHQRTIEELKRLARRSDPPRRHRLKRVVKPTKVDTAESLIERIERELGRLVAAYEHTSRKGKRIFLKAEIVHLRSLRDQIIGRKDRKPPEAGIAVPAVPPKGPLPKQGGATAPLDFDA